MEQNTQPEVTPETTEAAAPASDAATPESAAETPAPDPVVLALEARIQELDDEIHQLRREKEEYEERWLRAEADRQNTLKRARLEAEEARRFANQELLSQLLVVLDHFEHALQSARDLEVPPAYREGVEMIYRQLQSTLQKFGLQPIEATGQPFDPRLHEAIMQVEPQEGQAPHQVVEELRKGYKLHDRVLRPSLVKVTAG